jgi:signal transduction histidine kinase
MVPQGEDKFLGSNLSKRADWVSQTVLTEKSVYSNGYVGLDGKYRIGITVPIVNSTTNEFEGIFGVLVPVNQFFEHYGNIYNVNTKYLNVYDKNGTILLSPRTQFVGKNAFEDEFQKFIDHNLVYNNILESVIVKGLPAVGTYDIPAGQFLNTAYPIAINGDPVYAVAFITPTDTIYATLSKALQSSNFGTTLLLGAITLAVILLSILLYNWQNDLKKEVLARTNQLEEAKGRLEIINDRLVASERAKGEFISMVSNELRTPLMLIKAYSEMLLNPKYMGNINNVQKKAIESKLRNVTSLERLIGDVLDVYKMEMNRLKLNKVDTNISKLINDAVIEFKDIIKTEDKENNIRLESDVRISSELVLPCDPQRINQVIGNLVKNSIDFVPSKNGKITLKAEEREIKDVAPQTVTQDTNRLTSTRESTGPRSGKDILFIVEDNGPGFPADKVDHMFQKFYQVDTSLTRKHGGTGLGLVICKGIVEAHGGRIWIDKDYRDGASIKFTIPVNQANTGNPRKT